MNYTEINAAVWDELAASGYEWTRPVSHEEYLAAKDGELTMYLTPSKAVPRAWFPKLRGARVLGLASGGGQQGPIFAAHGAEVTIMDISSAQLDAETLSARREGYEVTTVKADMTREFPFADEAFDLIFHPVANNYIEDISHVWRECYRVLKAGGVLLAGFAKEELFMFEHDKSKSPPIAVANPLPYNPLRNPELLERENGRVGHGYCFSHTLEEQLGGQLAAGFTLTGIYDDRDRSGVFAKYMNTYAATRAVKPK